MISIIEVKKKQYFVDKKDMVLKVDRIKQQNETKYQDAKVLYYRDDKGKTWIGCPYVEGAVVKATVQEEVREKEIRVRRYQPKSGICKLRGHRQRMTVLRIENITIAAAAAASASVSASASVASSPKKEDQTEIKT